MVGPASFVYAPRRFPTVSTWLLWLCRFKAKGIQSLPGARTVRCSHPSPANAALTRKNPV